MFYNWLLIVILLIIIEALTTNLITIWFVMSGIVTLIVSLFINNIFLQLFIFVIGGSILMLTTKPILSRYLKQKNVKTNYDRIIGMIGISLSKIDNFSGEVKVDGKIWNAYSYDVIEANEKVEILKIESTKLEVKKVGK